MSLLKGTVVGKYFGAQAVFQNLDFSIEMMDRIGLVGPNGEGKTTLLEILAGVQGLRPVSSRVGATCA